MTSKIVVNNIEPDAGISTVSILGIATANNFKTGSSNLHSTGLNVNNTFVHSTGIALGAGSTIGAVTGVTTYYGDGSQLSGISVDSAKIETGTTKVQTSATLITNQISGVGIATVQAGGINVTGIVTATSYRGDGSQLTGISGGLPTSGGTLTGTLNSQHILPSTDDTYNLGSASKRWANIYTNDLKLSNEGKSNDVDGTWGSYIIQEGESDLFLINNRNGKKYKFNLTEVL